MGLDNENKKRKKKGMGVCVNRKTGEMVYIGKEK